MNTNELKALATISAGAPLLAQVGHSADANSVQELVANIQSSDDSIRGPAWQNAATAGAPAVKPLAGLMTHADFEVARSAKRALYKIVRHAGRPGASKEAKAVTAELIALLKDQPTVVRREALWMLSAIGGKEAINPMAALLSDAEAREDARCALMRLPWKEVTSVFRTEFKNAPEEFRFALAGSLRQRGEKVEGYPSQKLTPTKQTTVKPTEPKPAK